MSLIVLGICHCDVSARNLIMHSQETVTSRKNQWSFFAFSKSSFLNKLTSFQGGITSQGYPQFNTSTLPPEMFMKLSPSQLKAYTNYWIFVQEEFSVNIDQSVIEPIVDLRTGDSFVVKCHFIPLTDGSASLEKPMPVIPALPYDLISLQPSTDLWSLGQIIFLLCSGRPLLPFDSGSLRLLDYAAAYDWNPEPSIYEYILDPMAQDVLLTLLAIRSKREKVKLSDLLNHPFFLGQSACSPTLLKQITEKRRVECGAFKREQRKQVNANFEKEWLESRTDNISCWDFEILERIHLSPTEISRGMTARKERFNLPCNFIVLPYKLSMDIALTEEENEHAEQCGEGLLQLSKACYFTSVMKQATSSVVQDESNSHKWSSSEMLRVLDLSSDEFGDIQTEMASFAAKHVEAFRHDPMSVALKLVQTRIRNFLACFEDKPLYLYLIDEFSSLPILDDIFPVLVPDEWRENVLQNGILSMHLCSLHARGVARGIAGLLHLIYNDAETTIPPSLAEIGRGLNHKLDESAFVKEMQLLQAALTDMYGTKHLIYDDISTIHDFLSEIDPYRNLASVRRVVSGGSSLWTTCDGSRILDEISRTLTFKDALRRSRRHSHKLKEYKQKLDTLACEENGEAV